MKSILEAQTHEQLLQCVVDFYRPPEWNANDAVIYLGKLSKIPFQHVFTSVGELIETCSWMPRLPEWLEAAQRHWGDAERKRRQQNPQLGYEEQPVKLDEFWGYVKAQADAGNEWAKTVLANKIGKVTPQQLAARRKR